MAAAGTLVPKLKGGEFLVQASTPRQIFTVEDLNEEHWAVARTASEFFLKEVAPNVDSLQHQEPGLIARLLRRSAELGLTAIGIPEAYGGLDMDLASSLIAEERLGRDASYIASHSAHSGIGTLPILFFGTDDQKARYLPKLASAEMISAYALTEPHAGSDALAARMRADLTPDGKHYVLNGQKMWITNGGMADLFTVFAKVDGERFSAFLVERAFGGVQSGVEERKMGIKGSSTTAVYFENVMVPVANLLGEVGRGHVIAFNILNMGRLKLGAVSAAAAKHILEVSLTYANDRKAFGCSIADFGAIQHKLAEMAIRVYAAESAAWRITGLVQEHAGGMLQALEEYAVECSLMKVYGSEVLSYVVDEGVQIHGGYGFHQHYEVERAYRDARINRIFEGTNEINRLLITGMLLKRWQREPVPMTKADSAAGSSGDEEMCLVSNAKQVALMLLNLVSGKETVAQEVSMSISDVIIETFVMESALLRARKLAAGGNSNVAQEMTSVFLRDTMTRIEMAARNVLGACSALDKLCAVRKLTQHDPLDAVSLRRTIAIRLLVREKFIV